MAALIRALEGLVTYRGDIGWTKGMGGFVHEHQLKFDGYRRAGTEVELRGPCYSACTLIAAYLGKDKLCIAPDAFMAFHAARGLASGQMMPDVTAEMYWRQPDGNPPLDRRQWRTPEPAAPSRRATNLAARR
jgi:hypothetical protein